MKTLGGDGVCTSRTEAWPRPPTWRQEGPALPTPACWTGSLQTGNKQSLLLKPPSVVLCQDSFGDCWWGGTQPSVMDTPPTSSVGGPQ